MHTSLSHMYTVLCTFPVVLVVLEEWWRWLVRAEEGVREGVVNIECHNGLHSEIYADRENKVSLGDIACV